jgi:hypothetical protein
MYLAFLLLYIEFRLGNTTIEQWFQNYLVRGFLDVIKNIPRSLSIQQLFKIIFRNSRS